MIGTDTARNIVRALSASRLVCGVFLLPLAGVFEWWTFAALVFFCAFITDMVDGALARHWRVTSEAGGRLDSNADIFLTLGGVCAVVIAGAWPWWVVVVLFASHQMAMWFERNRLRGDALGLLILAVPLVNFALITALTATLFQLAAGMSLAIFLQLSIVFWAALAVIKRHRVLDYLQYAIRKSMPRDEAA